MLKMVSSALLGTATVAVFVIAGMSIAGTAEAHAGKEKIVLNFDGTDGYAPAGALIADAKGNLYGTTSYSGGNVFELSRGKHGWKETVLYKFTGGADGGGPLDSLTFDSQGNLYGTTYTGGQGTCIEGGGGCGVVFELTPSGKTWQETVLYSFVPGQQLKGGSPSAGVVFDKAGNLYGTTSVGNGTVYELSPANNGWQYQEIHQFTGGSSDGALPQDNLIIDSAGNLYGTATTGGSRSCYQGTGCGIVFELTPSNGGWTETVLHAFSGGTDGAYPYAGLMFDKSGNLYGTTWQGGGSNGCFDNLGCGTVFELTPGKSGWTENVLYGFPCSQPNCTVGSNPQAAVIMDASGNLYSTTSAGGTGTQGVVFELKPGNSSWTESVLHTFMPGTEDGEISVAPLLALPNGRMLGVTVFGGSAGDGTVFEIKR